jgi:hypothetical protein
MSSAILWRSSIISVATGPLSGDGDESKPTYLLMRSLMHVEKRNTIISTYDIVNAGGKNLFNRL